MTCKGFVNSADIQGIKSFWDSIDEGTQKALEQI